MHVFISAGEPSGDLHGANLIRALRDADPNVRISGFGGNRMKSAGAALLYPLCDHSVMWLVDVFKQILTFMKLLDDAEEFFRTERPDVLVIIDFPGFHWKLAQRAKRAGIPVVYFVPPQIWAWLRYRAKKMRRLVTHVLSALPFEHEWFLKKKINSHYIGHPYFDEIAGQQLDSTFMEEQQARSGRVIGILPGSRKQEVIHNIPEMLKAARRIAKRTTNVRFLVAAFNDVQAELVRRELAAHPPIDCETYVGRTPEIIELSTCCIAVSGSVSLELMYRLKPSVVVYRINRLQKRIAKGLMKVPYITLVNLLADKMIYPEFLTDRDPSRRVADRILEWMNDSASLATVQQELKALKGRVGEKGACARAAEFIRSLSTAAK